MKIKSQMQWVWKMRLLRLPGRTMHVGDPLREQLQTYFNECLVVPWGGLWTRWLTWG